MTFNVKFLTFFSLLCIHRLIVLIFLLFNRELTHDIDCFSIFTHFQPSRNIVFTYRTSEAGILCWLFKYI